MTARDALLALLDARAQQLARGVDVVHAGDALGVLRAMPSESVHTIICSPPYFGLRSYLPTDHPDKPIEIGLEETPAAYIARLVEIFAEARRVLRSDGIMFVNAGDSYASHGSGADGKELAYMGEAIKARKARKAPDGLKPKDLIGIPWKLAFALQAAGWYLRSAAPWVKRSAMPESVEDRPTSALEYVFLFSKSADYWFDSDAIRIGDKVLTRHGTKPLCGVIGEGRKDRANFAMDITTVGRNRRNTDWYFDALNDEIARLTALRDHGGVRLDENGLPLAFDINPEASNLPHFAAFPQALVEPMILAGCPVFTCPHCHVGYVRVVEKVATDKPASYHGSTFTHGKTYAAANALNTVGNGKRYDRGATLGFAPSCSCPQDAPPGAGIVLDMFFGTGTTGLMAKKHGRHYIGIELNKVYKELAEARIAYAGDDKRLLAERAAHVAQLALPGVGT